MGREMSGNTLYGGPKSLCTLQIDLDRGGYASLNRPLKSKLLEPQGIEKYKNFNGQRGERE